MLQALKNPGLRDRHWTIISTKVGTAINPEHPLTLNQLKGGQLHKGKNLKTITSISEQASKEMIIEQTLDLLEKEWKVMHFSIGLYKNSEIKVLKGVDEIYIVLEDNILKMQTIRASPYIEAFRDRIMTWEYKLKMIAEVLDEWMRA
jgi:dynein heavy chain